MKGIGRHLLAMAGIFSLSFVAGGFTGPADPVTMVLSTCVIFPVVLISYLIGVWLAPSEGENQRRQKLTITSIAFGLMIISSILFTLQLYDLAALRSDQPVDSLDYQQIQRWWENESPNSDR